MSRASSSALVLDEIDRQIIQLLMEDARRSLGDMAGRVSLSGPAVKRRVDRLVEAGVIQGFTAVLGLQASGWETEALVEIYCADGTPASKIGEAVRVVPEVINAWTVTGEADAIVHMVATDATHLEETLERIRSNPMIGRTKTMVVLSRLLSRTVPAFPTRPHAGA